MSPAPFPEVRESSPRDPPRRTSLEVKPGLKTAAPTSGQQVAFALELSFWVQLGHAEELSRVAAVVCVTSSTAAPKTSAARKNPFRAGSATTLGFVVPKGAAALWGGVPSKLGLQFAPLRCT